MPKFGIDVSAHNDSVDFNALKSSIDFCIIRCGYGGDYSDQDDGQFLSNVKKCKSAGIPYGVYLYSYALNTEQAKSEAQHAIRLLKQIEKPAYGVWFDMEDADAYKKKNGMPSNSVLIDICFTFCEAIEKAGYYTGIYASLSWLNSQLNSTKLDKFDKWVAQWNDKCQYKKAYGMWQNSSDGSFKTLSGRFDTNYAYKDYPSLTGKQGESNMSCRILKTGEAQITQGFSSSHGGNDIVKKTNQLDTITAHSAGTVVFCQTGIPNEKGSSGNRSYGNCVKIKHADGYYTLYAHMEKVYVSYGQTVSKGQDIGYMGNTGNSYGAHLHFEVRNPSDDRINPQPYINADLPNSKPDNDDCTGIITYQAYDDHWAPDVTSANSSDYAGNMKPICAVRMNPQYGALNYRIRFKDTGKWCHTIRNREKWAGTKGREIDGLQIYTTRGYVDAEVMTKESGWLPTVRFGKKYQKDSKGNEIYCGNRNESIIAIRMK